MPRDLEDKIRNFIAFNKKQIDVNSLQPAMIANMDETPIWADMPSATTVDSRGVHKHLFLNILCGFYSRAAFIQGRLLFFYMNVYSSNWCPVSIQVTVIHHK